MVSGFSLLLLIALIVIGGYVRTLWANQQGSGTDIRTLLKSAITGLYEPASISPKDGLQYAYEARVAFPLAATGAQNFQYGVDMPAGDISKAKLTLTTARTLSAGYAQLSGQTVSQIFTHVPTYQRCTLEFIVQFGAKDDGNAGFSAVATVKTKDGRTAYIYQNKDCAAFYKRTGINTDADLVTLKAMQSY